MKCCVDQWWLNLLLSVWDGAPCWLYLSQVVEVVLVVNPSIVGGQTVGFVGDVLHVQTHAVVELAFEELGRKERGGGGRRGQRQTNTRSIFTTRPGACVPPLHAAFWNNFIIIVCDDSVRLTIKWSLFSTVCLFQSLLRNIWLWSGLMTSTSTLGPSETIHHSGRTETVKTRDGTRWDLGLATKEYQVLS